MDSRESLKESLNNTLSAANDFIKYSIILNGGGAVAVSAMVVVRKSGEQVIMDLTPSLVCFALGCFVTIVACFLIFYFKVGLFDEILSEKKGKAYKALHPGRAKWGIIFLFAVSTFLFMFGVLLPVFSVK